MNMLSQLNKINVVNWLNRMIATDPREVTALILRVTLGVVLFAHGAQKLFGWFGGAGFDGTMSAFTVDMNLPWVIAFLVILIESIGAILLILGLGTRFVAAGIAAIMIGAITIHWENGFFMDWNNIGIAEGFEYHLLALAMAIVLVLKGGGLYAVDGFLSDFENGKGSLHHENGSMTGGNGKSGTRILLRRQRRIIVRSLC